MRIESSPYWIDVDKVIKSKKRRYSIDLRATIHTAEIDLDVLRVISVDIVRDYVHAYADQTVIEVYIGLGDYIKDIYPHRRNLELTLYEYDVTDNYSEYTFERFKAVFIEKMNPIFEGQDYGAISKQTLNIGKVQPLKLQLVNLFIEPLSAKTVQGTFKDTNPVELLRSVITFETRKVLVGGKPILDGLEIVPEDNKEKTKYIIIPSHTPLKNLPTMAQERFGGIYNTGMGNYLQMFDIYSSSKDELEHRKIWFIYPLFDIERFDQTELKVVIYHVPSTTYSDVEKTFYINNDTGILSIVTTSEMQYQDNRQNSQYKEGVGFRIANAKPMMTKPVTTKSDGPVAVRKKLNTELANEAMPDQMTTGIPLDDRVSANNFTNASRVLSLTCGMLTVIWKYSKPNIVLPGMPCQYKYLKNGNIITLNGTLLYAQHFRQLDGKSLVAPGHVTTSVLGIYADMTGNIDSKGNKV
jgi:hypothetical protein